MAGNKNKQQGKTKVVSKGKNVKKVNQRYNQMLTSGRKLSESSSARMALQHSKYLNSVLDPFNEPGAKIPDDITAPSFTAQTITKFVRAAQPGAGAGATTVGFGMTCVVGSTEPNNSPTFCDLTPSSFAEVYGSTGAAGTWTGGSQIIDIGSLVRPVSAGVVVQVLGSYNNNQGRILIGYLPPNAPISPWAIGQNTLVSDLASATYVADIPASKVAGRAIWLPIDALARSYCTTGTLTQTNARGQFASGSMLQYGALFALVDGLITGVNVEFQFCVNWEIIPETNQTNIVQASVSRSDPLELAVASNFIAANPTIAQHQPSSIQVTGTPMSGMIRHKEDHPSFLDQVMGGLEKGMSFAKKVAPIAGELLAML